MSLFFRLRRHVIFVYAVFLIVILFSNILVAHEAAPIVPSEEDSESAAARRAAIQKAPRFLGWKFSKLAKTKAGWYRKPKTPDPSPISAAVRSSAASPGMLFLHAGPEGSDAGFNFRNSLPTGFIPTAITDGDFNEDGHMDVAVSNGGDNSVWVLLGNGDGTFGVPEILYTRGQAPVWITSVKLRNSSHVDLAVANADSANVEVFLGKGDGTFQQGPLISLPQIPTFILPADVNQDGKQDLVIGLVIDTDSTQPQFQVLLGNGAGCFLGNLFPPAIYGNPDGPIPTGWVSVGDFKKDGFPDVLATVTGLKTLIYVSHSGTSFSIQASTLASGMAVELGDMDEDGCLDAVTTSGYGYLIINKGSCDGNFSQSDNLAQIGDLDPAIKLIDVNGDGHLDVVASAAFYDVGGPGYGSEGGYLVSVLRGDGRGNAAPPQIYRGGTNAYSLIVADFNGDNKPEIVTADSLEDRASIFINDGSGNYDGPQGEGIGYLIGPINAPYPIGHGQSIDLNGDGKPDYILVELGAYSDPDAFTSMLNDGTGKFLPPVRSPITVGETGPVPEFIAGFFRTTAAADLIYLNTYNGFNDTRYVAYFRGNGDGSFRSPVTLATLPDPLKLATGDFNKDGKLDVAVYGSDGTGANQELDIFLGHGDGTFTQVPSLKFPRLVVPPQQLIAGDFNHDGKLDLLIANDDNGGWMAEGDDLLLALGNGNGTFLVPTVLMPHFGAVAVGDLNHDGYLDLVQKKDPNEDVAAQLFFSPAVTIYLGQASGTFKKQPTYYLPGVGLPSYDSVILGDFNGDDNLDIAYRYLRTQYYLLIEARLHILQGVGDGSFKVAGHPYQLQALSSPFLGADFNGDHKDDLIELTGYTSSFHTILGSTPPAIDIAFNSNPILGNSGKASVTLNQPASSAVAVILSVSDPAVQLPASLHFSVGQQTQQFSFTLGSGLNTSHVIALYAQLGTETAVDYGYKPNPNMTTGVAASLIQGFYPLYPNLVSVTPGESFVLALELDSVSGYTGTFSSFNCAGLPANASCTFDGNSLVLLPGGVSRVNFTVTTSTSTPFGTFPLQITSTDGFFAAATTFSLGIGNFSLAVNPSLISIGPSGTNNLSVIATPINGLNEDTNLTCSGLPVGARCSSNLPATSGTTIVQITGSQVAAGDYPFHLTMQAHVLSHTVNATLRVGDFSASLDKTTGTLSSGQSANFVLTLDSINHYVNNIGIFCQPPTNNVSCSVSNPTVSLTDSGNSTVTLTVSRPAATQHAQVKNRNEFLLGTFVLAGLALPLFTFTRKSKAQLALMLFVALMSLPSCGGGTGTNAGGTNPPPPPPPPPPQTVSISVIAQADSTFNDSGDQKVLGPIVITVK
jgi:hypothetical protein